MNDGYNVTGNIKTAASLRKFSLKIKNLILEINNFPTSQVKQALQASKFFTSHRKGRKKVNHFILLGKMCNMIPNDFFDMVMKLKKDYIIYESKIDDLVARKFEENAKVRHIKVKTFCFFFFKFNILLIKVFLMMKRRSSH